MAEAHRSPAGSRTGRDIRTRAAWLYYVEGLTQEQVARSLDVSRIAVIRALAAARDDGIVQIRIDTTAADLMSLERDLAATFGLEAAAVVPAPRDPARTSALVGHAAGVYLSDHVRDGMTVAIGWGETLSAALPAITPRPVPGLAVASLLGGVAHASTVEPSAVVWRLAEALGAECHQLMAPVFVTAPALRQALWAEPSVAALARRVCAADIALLSVGEVGIESTLFRHGLLAPGEITALRDAGAVGEILCRFVDANGRSIDHPVNERVMAVDPDALRQVPTVIVASGGARKIPALHAALRSGIADVLITDEIAARGLLAREASRGLQSSGSD
jgi:DNA-binding transcriptional regulator LsrR (DeoR family)